MRCSIIRPVRRPAGYRELAGVTACALFLFLALRFPAWGLLGGVEHCYGDWSGWVRIQKSKEDIASILKAQVGLEAAEIALRQAEPFLPKPPKTRCPMQIKDGHAAERFFRWGAAWLPYGKLTTEK